MTYLRTPSADAGASAGLLEVRRHNLALVMARLRAAGPRSRATLAAETGLTKATVSSLVAELVGRGLVAEGETERGAVGRPSQQVDLRGSAFFTVGCEVNLDYVAVIALDARAEVVAERWVPLDAAGRRPEVALPRLAALVLEVVATLSRGGAELLGVAIAVPGLVERSTGRVLRAPNLGWSETPVTETVRALLGDPGCPLLLDNEANLAARAELEAGGRAAVRDLVLVTGVVGVGAGIVAGGQLLRGVAGFAGEVGHMQLEPGGRRCGCGRRGCWETLVGLGALLDAAADEHDPVRDPTLDLVRRLDRLKSRARDGDRRTLDALGRTAEWLGVGAAILVNLYNPEVLVLGGYFAELGPWVAEPLESRCPAWSSRRRSGGCRVELSTLGFSAAARGGALEALTRIFDDPTAVATAVPAAGDPVPMTSGAQA